MRVGRILILAALTAAVPAASAAAATIPVTTTADVIADDGLCSLREAVFAARFDQALQGCPAGSGDDVIQLAAGEYRATGVAGEDGNMSGDFDTGPAGTVEIAGRGMGVTAVAGVADRVFQVQQGATLRLSDLTVRDGLAPPGGDGGAVSSRGTLTVLRVAFTNNVAGDGRPGTSFDESDGEPGGGGGAIWSGGQLLVSSSVFSGNRAGRGADGRHFERQTGTGTNSRDVGPRPGGSGGAILVAGGTAAISGSTFTGSRAGTGGNLPPDVAYSVGGSGGSGGAVAVTGGAATVDNSTFQGNTAGNATSPRTGYEGQHSDAGDGGGVAAVAPGTLSVSFSTFSGNGVGTGPTGPTGAGASLSGASVNGSILADVPGACSTLTPAAIPNVTLPGDTSCPGARIAGDPRLGPLADNGGPTPTMAPGAGSVALNAISGLPCPATDQRGLPRPALGACDAGAVELQPGQPGAPAPGSGPGGGTTAGRRTIAKLKLGPAPFRTSGKKAGTTVRFTLDAAGRVVLTVTKPAAGRRSKGRCLAPTRRLAGARKCTRQVTVPGKLAVAGALGPNAVRFSGKLRGKALKPGPYTLVLTLPRAAASPAVSARKAFRILG